MPRVRARVWPAFLVGAFWIAPLAAQVAAGASLSLATPYVWRGITRANGASLEPEAFLSAGVVRGYLTAGAWANYELGPRSPGHLSDIGSNRPGWSEADYWAQFARNLGELETTAGVMRYTYQGEGAGAVRTGAANTTELYAALQMSSTYLVPRLTAYLDVDHVKGVYLEGSATVPLLAYPFGNPLVIYLNGLAGYNVSQEQNPDRPNQGANFRYDGFTHFDVSLRFTLSLGRIIPLGLNLEPHWQFKVDPFTQRTSPEPGDATRHFQFWLGVSVSTGVTLVPGGRK
jgi:hypothetical protein